MKKEIPKKLKFALSAGLPGLAVLAAAAIMYVSESHATHACGFWSIVERVLIVLMGEYPDQPHTVVARIIQVLLLMFSTVLVAGIVGKISALFVGRMIFKEAEMKNHKNFVVVCNWNKEAKDIISELLEADPDIEVLVVHVHDVTEELKGLRLKKERVFFYQDDPMRYEVLKRLRLLEAKSAILLADDGVENPDDKNVLIALAIKHLEGKENDVYVVAELTDSTREKHLLDAGADEVVCTHNYTAGIIAQSALYRKMSEVYHRLLTYSEDSNEIYFVPGERAGSPNGATGAAACYPDSFVGKRFSELVSEIAARSSGQASPILLIGIKRNGEISLNPRPGSGFDILQKGDDLIVLAYQKITRID